MSEDTVDYTSASGYTEFVTRLASQPSMVSFETKLATAALGLGGEVGEVADIAIQSRIAGMTYELSDKLVKELGDIMWYVAFACGNVADWPLRALWPDPMVRDPMADEHATKVALLDMWAIRLSYRCSLFVDTAKKLLFHGKPYDEDVRRQLVGTLGDITEIVTIVAFDVCGVQLRDVVKANVDKLSARYKTLQFSTAEFLEKEAGKRE
jgi:hypothetical protein